VSYKKAKRLEDDRITNGRELLRFSQPKTAEIKGYVGEEKSRGEGGK